MVLWHSKKYYLMTIVFFFSFYIYPAHGSLDNFDEKFQIEKKISERLEQVLKTRLDKAYFDITVEVVLNEGANIHSQNIRDKIVYKANGEKDLLQTLLLHELIKNKNNLEIETLKVTLGLSDKVQPAYREELKKWLSAWTQSSLGKSASSEVLVRPTNIIDKDSQSENFISSFFAGLGAFQNLIGMLFLGSIFLVTYFKRRPIEGVASSPPSPQIINVNQTERIAEVEQIDYQPKDQQLLKTLKNRVGVVGKTMTEQVEYLIGRWATKDNEDILKIVALLEALAEAGVTTSNLQIETLPALSKEASASLSHVFSRLHKMPSDDLIKIYEEIYTELVAGNLIRLSLKQSSFEFLDKMESSDLKEIFSQLSGPYQITLLSKMSDDAKYNFSNSVDPDFFKNLLEASFEFHHISDQDLLGALEKIGVKINQPPTLASDLVEQKIQRLRQLWAGFSRKEEALWMYHFVKRNPEMKKYFEQDFNHLAFLGDWPYEELRKFCLQIRSVELAAAIKSLPHLSQPVLSVCGEQMRAEVIHWLNQMDDPRILRNFESFAVNFDDYVKSEKGIQVKDSPARSVA